MYLDILVLGHLASRPSHGYEIKKRVQDALGPALALNNNVLYPALRRFEEIGAVEGRLEPQQGSPPRRVYQLTERGHRLLRELLEQFPPEAAGSEEEFWVRLAYFHLIGPKARLAILRRRIEAVERLAAHLRASLERAERSQHLYASRLLRFLIDRQLSELAWLGELADEEGSTNEG